MHFKQSIIITILLTAAVGMAHAEKAQADESVDLNALYQEIDEAILQSPQFVAERERQIEACRTWFLREKNA